VSKAVHTGLQVIPVHQIIFRISFALTAAKLQKSWPKAAS